MSPTRIIDEECALLEGVVIGPCPADRTHKSADRRKAEEITIKISKYINNTTTSPKKNDPPTPSKNEGGNLERG